MGRISKHELKKLAQNAPFTSYQTEGEEEMKDIQKKSAERVQESIGDCEPTTAKSIIWNTFGRNNWRKMHGFPLMRREVEKLGRKIHRQYRG